MAKQVVLTPRSMLVLSILPMAGLASAIVGVDWFAIPSEQVKPAVKTAGSAT